MIDSADDLHGLVQRCLQGDQDAMLSFVDRYRDMVFRLCYRMLGQRQDAEDAAQETFIRALRHLPNWDPGRRMEPWLLTIAGNRCRTMIAARKRQPPAAPVADAELIDRSPSESGSGQLGEELALALRRIRPEHREAFLLFHEHNLSYDEISRSLGRPLGTIKTWIRRARQELAGHLRRRRVQITS